MTAIAISVRGKGRGTDGEESTDRIKRAMFNMKINEWTVKMQNSYKRQKNYE